MEEAKNEFLTNVVNGAAVEELSSSFQAMHGAFDQYRTFLHADVLEAMREHQAKLVMLEAVYSTRVASLNVLERVEEFLEDGRISGADGEIIYPRFKIGGRLYERLGSAIYDPNNVDPNYDPTFPYDGLPTELVGHYAPTVWLIKMNREDLDTDHDGQLSEEEKRRIPFITIRMMEQYKSEKNIL